MAGWGRTYHNIADIVALLRSLNVLAAVGAHFFHLTVEIPPVVPAGYMGAKASS